MGCLVINKDIMKEAAVAILSGEFEKTKSKLTQNNNEPLPIACWIGNRRGVADCGVINSCQLTYALHDAFLHEKYYKEVHVEELISIHKKYCQDSKRIDYGQMRFIKWNWLDEPGDNEFFDEENAQLLRNTGILQVDIDLANYGIQHMEDKVVQLLKQGASPYFFVADGDYAECYIDKEDVKHYTCFDIAPMPVHCIDEIELYWHYIPHDFPTSIREMSEEEIANEIEAIFNIAANKRILRLVADNIDPVAQKRGEELSVKYLGENWSVKDYI